MKYMERGGFQTKPLMRLTLNFTLLFLLGLWVSNFFLYFSKMGLSTESVISYYLGSEAQYTLPRTFQSMMEVTHMHLPMMAIVILMLTHLVIFAPFPDKFKVTIISASFLSAFIGELSGWLVRFVNPHFAILKIVCFVTFQAMLIFLIFTLAKFLWMSHEKKKRTKHRKAQ